MSIKENFKTVGNKVVQTFRPKGGIILNAIKANERIVELEKQLEAKETVKKEVKVPEPVTTPSTKIDFSGLNELEYREACKANGIKPNPHYKPSYHDFKTTDKTITRYEINAPKTTVLTTSESTFITTDKAIFEFRNSPDETSNIAKGVPVYFVKQGYYLLYDNGVAYYLSNTQVPQKNSRNNLIKCIPTILAKNTDKRTDGQIVNNQNIVITNIPKQSPAHLSKEEFDNLVKVQPSKEDLFKVYVQWMNKEEVEMNINSAKPIF